MRSSASIETCRLPLVVGGTGLYVRTLLKGLCDAPPADPLVRAALRQEAKDQGHDRLYARLVAVDPVAAARLHPRDESKVIRALEVYRLSGRRMSEFQQEHRVCRTALFRLDHRLEPRPQRAVSAYRRAD